MQGSWGKGDRLQASSLPWNYFKAFLILQITLACAFEDLEERTGGGLFGFAGTAHSSAGHTEPL